RQDASGGRAPRTPSARRESTRAPCDGGAAPRRRRDRRRGTRRARPRPLPDALPPGGNLPHGRGRGGGRGAGRGADARRVTGGAPVLCCPDKFRGSLTANEAAEALADGVEREGRDA